MIDTSLFHQMTIWVTTHLCPQLIKDYFLAHELGLMFPSWMSVCHQNNSLETYSIDLKFGTLLYWANCEIRFEDAQNQVKWLPSRGHMH